MAKAKGSKQRILDYLLANVGRVISHEELQQASGGASEWGRRVRELRDEEGYQILSHRDSADMKPGQYKLASVKRRPAFKRDISKDIKAHVYARNGHACQMCGVAAGDPDPYHPERTVRLTIGHIKEKSAGGEDTPNNLRAICSNCNESLGNTSPPSADRLQLLNHVRRAAIDDQKAVLDWLLMKFRLKAVPQDKVP